jgi:oxygen-dependent protoporphyrinogen oxidase
VQASSARKTIVVGAGLAGLAAARRLEAAGQEVEVVDRANRVGGRATHDVRDGFTLDCGPHLVSGRDRALLRLIAESALPEPSTILRPSRSLQLRQGRAERIDPTGFRGVMRIPGVRWLDGLRTHRLERLTRKFESLLDAADPGLAARLDDRSIADFVNLYFGRSTLDRWVAPYVASELHADVGETSRLLFWRHWAGRRLAPTGEMRGGLGSLAEALATQLKVELGVVVTSLARDGERLVLETVGGRREADAVVLAVPAAHALEIAGPVLRHPERVFLDAGRSDPAIVASIALEHSFAYDNERIRVPADEGLPVTTIAMHHGGLDGPAPAGQDLVTLVATAEWSRQHLEAADDVVEKAMLGVLQRVYPGAAGAVRFVNLRRHRHGFPRFDVGRFRAIARFQSVQADLRSGGRRLVFASDGLIAPTMEGAVQSGERAAADLLGMDA